MATVTLEHVEKVYPGGVKAVEDFNLEINDGEFVVLVGPSGCGKSTTLRMIAGLEEISGGIVKIGGRVVNDVPPKNRDIAMVFQNYALYPHMSVAENMGFGLKLRGFPKAEIKARVAEAAEILGITDYLHRRPKALSGGQRQRVAVGRAIVRKPSVFLFDEPLSNLDAKMRVQMRVEISRLHKRLGATMIYVTHDQVEAMTMGERIVVMRDGWMQQVAAPLELYNKPANLFIAGFIGMPPMNCFPGAVRKGAAGLEFVSPTFSTPIPKGVADTAADGMEVTLGLRPEDIGSILAEAEEDAPKLRGTVEMVEQMGHESYVYLKAGSCDVVCRVAGDRLFRTGEEAALAIRREKIHLFDSEGVRIP
ncbi:MAG: ABC transporter ATP-binding protein [Kiritimatiellia bacterium]|jgi:multiple sugar transport system ATP-binding protein